MAVAVFFAVLYILAFFIPKAVVFSYAEARTCVRQLTVFPDIHATTTNDRYAVEYGDDLTLGEVRLASMSVCLRATAQPSEGTVVVQASPFGGPLARKTFHVATAQPPTPRFAATTAISVSKPLQVPLSSADAIHTYKVRAKDTVAPCRPQAAVLECDIPTLKLAQGKTYTLELLRHFRDQPGRVVATEERDTLRATKVTKSSIKHKQVVYDRPKTITFTLDKPLVSASVLLRTADKKAVKTEVVAKDRKVTVELEKELERSQEYRMVLSAAEAQDGSSLEEPHNIAFTTSGGPKVTGVSIGKNRVGLAETIVLTFDQKLSSKVSAASKVKVAGGKADVSVQGKQVLLSLRAMPKCQPFTITVSPGLVSDYGVKAKDTWSYASRTICHTVEVYGYSREGRPLLAYYFGTAGVTTLYVGGIHGNEPSSKYILDDWMGELEANPNQMPKNRQIVVVPSINPDGIARNTRNNAKGVNLNRNFPTDNWRRHIDDTDGYRKNGGGSKPLSEPEAKALASLVQRLRPRLMMSYHAVGSVVIGDKGGYSEAYAARYASMVGYRNATGQSSSVFDYSITGSFEDWAYQKVGVSNMVIELGSYTYRNFPHHREAFWAMLR